jgi:hypothetical protein
MQRIFIESHFLYQAAHPNGMQAKPVFNPPIRIVPQQKIPVT